MPVKRNEYVLSRYLLGIVSILLASILLCIVYFVSIKINDLQGISLNLLLPTSITSAILSMSVIIPLVLKFGINKGRVFMSIIVILVSTMPLSLMSDISQDSKTLETIMNIINSVGMPLITVVINIIILLVSIGISINLYKNKEIKE